MAQDSTTCHGSRASSRSSKWIKPASVHRKACSSSSGPLKQVPTTSPRALMPCASLNTLLRSSRSASPLVSKRNAWVMPARTSKEPAITPPALMARAELLRPSPSGLTAATTPSGERWNARVTRPTASPISLWPTTSPASLRLKASPANPVAVSSMGRLVGEGQKAAHGPSAWSTAPAIWPAALMAWATPPGAPAGRGSGWRPVSGVQQKGWRRPLVVSASPTTQPASLMPYPRLVGPPRVPRPRSPSAAVQRKACIAPWLVAASPQTAPRLFRP